MHKRAAVHVLFIAAFLATAAPAAAQRFSFERSFDAGPDSTLDVSTMRGKIHVSAGEPGRILVTGTATVRVAWNVPVNAIDLARMVAERPPVAVEGAVVTLRAPSDPLEQRAMTISYEVRVPRDTRVLARSDSGAITVDGVAAPVVLRTQSAAILLTRLGGSAAVTTGSGDVEADRIDGALSIETASSAITARDVRGGLHVRTNSGAVDAMLTGPGDVDVRTSSSAITLHGVSGSLATNTRSGRTKVTGFPKEDWSVSAGSGSIEVTFDAPGSVSLDAETGSGSVNASGVDVDGSVAKQRVVGDVRGGGAHVRLASRSGSIQIRGAGAH